MQKKVGESHGQENGGFEKKRVGFLLEDESRKWADLTRENEEKSTKRRRMKKDVTRRADSVEAVVPAAKRSHQTITSSMNSLESNSKEEPEERKRAMELINSQLGGRSRQGSNGSPGREDDDDSINSYGGQKKKDEHGADECVEPQEAKLHANGHSTMQSLGQMTLYYTNARNIFMQQMSCIVQEMTLRAEQLLQRGEDPSIIDIPAAMRACSMAQSITALFAPQHAPYLASELKKCPN